MPAVRLLLRGKAPRRVAPGLMEDLFMQQTNEPENPGDEGPPDAPGVGESPCHACRGTGTVEGQPCTVCGGTGRILQGIGGG